MKKYLKYIYTRALNAMPYGGIFDSVFWFLKYLECHKRMPGKMLFNDVLYRLKVSDEITDPLRIFVTDKHFVKLFVKAVLGEAYNVPTIAVFDRVEDAIAYQYPDECCIKPTHAAGLIQIRKNGSPVDHELIKKWFQINYYDWTREKNYQPLLPKVIVEPLIFGSDIVDDFKFFCYNGIPRLVQVDEGRFSNHRRVIFDVEWNMQNYRLVHERPERIPPKPDNLEKMIFVAQELSRYFRGFVRIDLYSDGRSCLVGEITNCHGGAGENFIPPESELEFSRVLFDSP